MKVACICVTKGGKRVNVFGIAAASFATQIYGTEDEARLWVDFLVAEDVEVYQRVARVPLFMSLSSGDVPQRLHYACRQAFDDQDFDLCAIWDDDDYYPPTRLSRSLAIFRAMPNATGIVGYRSGYFCNLRTLTGYEVENQDGAPWGNSLMFTRAAFEAAGGFANRKSPGYDRSFVTDVKKAGLGVVKIEDRISPPVAFSHGDNVATWLMKPGKNLCRMLERAPERVLVEIERAQAWLVERGIYPPQTPGG